MRIFSRCGIPLTLMLASFILLPLAAVHFIPPDAGMMAMLLLFYCINPISSILIGILAGKQTPTLWFLPFLSAGVFCCTACLLFGWDSAFVLYAGVYLLPGMLAALISRVAVRRRS